MLEAASVGGLFGFKPSARCLLLALSGHSSSTRVCPLLGQSGRRWSFGRGWLGRDMTPKPDMAGAFKGAVRMRYDVLL